MLQELIKIFERDIERLKKEIEECEEDKLWKTLNGIKNPVGNLCLHLIGNLNTYVGKNLGRTNYVRNREFEFSQKDLPKSLLLENIEATKKIVDQALKSLNEKQLEEMYPEKVFDYEMTTGYFLIHLAAHLSYHLGQINYLRRITS
jgi:hypothetical protein